MMQNENMNYSEEVKKYLFDPERPETFTTYKVLVKILKDSDNIVFLSNAFLFELLHDEIFDAKFKAELWDIPENYDALPAYEKYNLYIKNYSWAAAETIKNKIQNLKLDFKEYLYVNSHFAIVRSNNMSTQNVLNYNCQNSFYLNKNSIIFVDSLIDVNVKTPSINVLNHIFSKHTVLVVSTLENYEAIQKSEIVKNYNAKILLLKDIRDVRKLLAFAKREAEENKEYIDNQAITPSYLSKISIENYFTLKNIALENLDNQREIYFLGENGQGKTLLLQAIVLALKGHQAVGTVLDFTKVNKDFFTLQATDNQGISYNYKQNSNEIAQNSFDAIVAYGVNRIAYDTKGKDTEGYLTLFTPFAKLDDPIEWLKYLDHKALRNEAVGIDLKIAIELLQTIFEKQVRIEVTAENVYFFENESKLLFEQLSDGFKSVMIWLGDMLVRFSKKQPSARSLKDFTGVVLIDEIDLLLHPKWQYRIVRDLRKWFPNMQFIITTHSPTTILGASRDATFYKVYKENGETKISAPYYNENLADLRANHIITSPLFDMESARMAAFDPQSEEVETTEDYLAARIHRQIKAQIEAQKAVGKVYFSAEEIDNMIAEILQ